MLRLLGLELKIQFKLKKTWVIVLIGMLMSLIVTIFTLSTATSREIIFDSKGEITSSYGKSAVEYLKTTQKDIEGYITEDKLVEVVEQYFTVLHQYNSEISDIPLSVYASELTPLGNILDMISYSFIMNYDGELEGILPKDFMPEEAKTTYERRKSVLRSMWENSNLPEVVIEKLDAKEEALEEPFYFSSFAGWDSFGVNHSLLFNPIIILLTCVLIAPNFSRDYETGADRVIRATKLGKKQLAIARILSSLILAFAFYSICFIISFSISSSVFNIGGLKADAQCIYLFTSSNLSLGGLIGVNLMGSVLALVTMSLFTLFLSATLKSTVFSFAISVGFIMLNTIFNILNSSTILHQLSYFFVNTFSPFGGINLFSAAISNDYLIFNEFVLWLPYAIIMMSSILSITFITLIMKTQCKS